MSLPAAQQHFHPSTSTSHTYEDMMDRVHEDMHRWGPLQQTTTLSTHPCLHLDDLTGIPFTENVVGVELYQQRARVRAKTGDMFAASCPPVLEYEWYNRKVLGLGSPTFIHAFDAPRPDAVAEACRSGFTLHHLAALANRSGGLTVHPYMGILSVWQLASELQDATEMPIRVLGPTPAATQLANNKVFFTQFIEEHFHSDWVAPSKQAHTPEGMAMGLYELAQKYPKVALKMPECASAMGIEVFAAKDILGAHPQELVHQIDAFLTEKEWEKNSPVQMVAWLSATHSPSSQVWISGDTEEVPDVQGIYEQLFTGPEKVFLGSTPSDLPKHIQTKIKDMSASVAKALQKIGYVGRCSFDFIIVNGKPIFIECNGRWGGTSTPMHLVDRIFPEGRPQYVAKDIQDDRLIGCRFKDLVEAFGDRLYRPQAGTGSFILYNVGCLAQFGKFDVIAIGATQEEAINQATVTLEQILSEM